MIELSANAYAQSLRHMSQQMDERFRENAPIAPLIVQRARFIDGLLRKVWDKFPWPEQKHISLVAVGGYGRQELHPYSDIDLMILLDDYYDTYYHEIIEKFLTHLWDSNLPIGHSVRSMSETRQQANDDITVITNLMESRLLAGSAHLHSRMLQAISPQNTWPCDKFFLEKWFEQNERHRRYANTEYNLEPDVKDSPGGLRDLQTLGWIAKRLYGTANLQDLMNCGFLTSDMGSRIKSGRDFLWRVRYGLHMISQRAEDRLLFQHQLVLAKLFRYDDDDEQYRNLGVERFMQQYYRCAMTLGEINEVLLQRTNEQIIHANIKPNICPINERFEIYNNYIRVTNKNIFHEHPSALLEIFLLLAQNKDIEGIAAETLIMLRDARHLIDDRFRTDPINTALFIDFLRAPHNMAQHLNRMKRQGILEKYIPEVGDIIGMMQYDLFHVYTVDAHTIKVINNMCHFCQGLERKKFSLATIIAQRLDTPELLYIAGLFHDIGKGRKGDHSQLGAQDADRFCRRHGLTERDTQLVVWLVENHLTMSRFIKRKDISEPTVIQEFSSLVQDIRHLNYLYVLTIADINATNPQLWTNWTATLLRHLYLRTYRALRRGLTHHIDRQDIITANKGASYKKLIAMNYTKSDIHKLWQNIDSEYFLNTSKEDVIWHTTAIVDHLNNDQPLILVKESTRRAFEGATQIFTYCADADNFFITLTSVLDKLRLNIQDARIFHTDHHMQLSTFYVLDIDNQPLHEEAKHEMIRQYLSEALLKMSPKPSSTSSYIFPRRIQNFKIPTRVKMNISETGKYNVLEIVALDQPGILVRVAHVLSQYKLKAKSAHITTLGERVEDIFYLSDRQNSPVRDRKICAAIENTLFDQLKLEYESPA